MLYRFRQFIEQNDLFSAEDRILLAVSGGMDSMAMVRLFREAACKFGIAHCNFKLRGEASDGDEEFAECICRVLSDEEVRERLQRNAVNYIRAYHDHNVLRSTFLNILKR